MSLPELKEEFNIQKKKINIFVELIKNDKIMENVAEEVLYIEPSGYFQFLKRWWYGEDKQTTFKHLNKYFIEFMRFLDKVLVFARTESNVEFVLFGTCVCTYINCLIPGIHTLKQTYPDYVELHNKIASIIITLIDFKTEFRQAVSATTTTITVRKRSPSF